LVSNQIKYRSILIASDSRMPVGIQSVSLVGSASMGEYVLG